ncbi:DUF507 family protein [Candidatus Fermentibacteria bacterium]|nr:DUF507 family protein [Candidatus Fermentibacteria bacterium]
MRLSRHRVERLAQLVATNLVNERAAEIRVSPDEIESIVARAINHNLEEEAAIDAEVRDLLLKHSAVMIREGVDQRTAFVKVKAELAKRRGFVL